MYISGLGLNFWPCSEGYFLSGHNLKCSAVKKIQRFSSKENPKVQKQTDNLKGSAVNRYIIQGITLKVQQ